MSFRVLCGVLAASVLLSACGGGDQSTAPAPTRLLAGATVAGAAEVRTFTGMRSDYLITAGSGGYLVVNLAAGGATTTVGPTARLRFADVSVVLGADGLAPQLYRLYQAAFNRTPDAAGLGYWLGVMERGASIEQVSAGFVGSKEYQDAYGTNPGNDQVVSRYYQNVLHRAGDPAGYAYWKDILDRKAGTPAQVLVGFTDSAENKAGVQDAIKNGIALIEPGVAYAPAARVGTDRKVDPFSPVQLDGSASTVEFGKTIAYSWSIASRPAGSAARLSDPAAARPSFTPDIPGVYEFALVVSDGAASSQPARVRIDASLWAPAEGALPASGNAIYLQSDAGDYIGSGKTLLYTPANATLTVSATGSVLKVGVNGDTWWNADFAAMSNLTKLQRGWYPGLSRYPFHNPAKGGLDWGGDGRGCNTLTGWFLVDSVTYDGDKLTAIDLRFEQHCEGGAAALHGRIRWSADDTSTAPGPIAAPAGLWQPLPSSTPASGNYVYLESTPGDYIGSGRSYTYTDANAVLKWSATGAHAMVSVTGDKWWSGDFAGMNTLARLVPGYYGSLQRYPFSNPVKGGLSWSGDGRGCNTLTGWFVVDKITYVQDAMTELDLRFEQHCEGGPSALRGKLHWSASDSTTPPGPIVF
jgi:hypothetical protein